MRKYFVMGTLLCGLLAGCYGKTETAPPDRIPDVPPSTRSSENPGKTTSMPVEAPKR